MISGPDICRSCWQVPAEMATMSTSMDLFLWNRSVSKRVCVGGNFDCRWYRGCSILIAEVGSW
jgi:hypothetical protein